MNGYVYLIHATKTDFYKIGFTTDHPSKRLARLQTGTPHKLELVAKRVAPRKYERILHRKFREFSVGNGEWFEFKTTYKVLPYFSKNAEVGEPQKKVWTRDAIAREIANQVLAYTMGMQLHYIRRKYAKTELSESWYMVADELGFVDSEPKLTPKQVEILSASLSRQEA